MPDFTDKARTDAIDSIESRTTLTLQLLDFYANLLPGSGAYCLFALHNRRNYWCHSLEELAAKTVELQDHDGLYFATARFQKAGDSYSGRTQSNVGGLKALRLDIDAGPDKLAKHGEDAVYATQRDAIADVVRYSKDHGIPPSTIVSSGEGLHIYYALDREVTPAEWQPVARALHNHGTAHGLKIDSAVTTDSSRLLRPIGTLHPNGKRVTVLKHTGKIWTLAELGERLGNLPDNPLAGRWGPDALKVNAELGLNDTARKHTPFSMMETAKHCAAVRMAMEDRGACTPYQPWLLALQTAALSEEGEDLGHEISDGHEDYDPVVVDRKMASFTGGPPSCETWHRAWGAKSPCLTCLYGGIGQ